MSSESKILTTPVHASAYKVHDRVFSVFIAKLIIRGVIFAHNRAEAVSLSDANCGNLFSARASSPALGAHLRTTLCRSGGHAN